MPTRPDPADHVREVIERIGPVWQERMHLAHVDIAHVFVDEYRDDDEGTFHTTAVTEPRWQYFYARVKWYLKTAVTLDDATIEATLVHEYVHVGLAPEQVLIDARLLEQSDGTTFLEQSALSERYYEHLEMSTEWAARAFLKAWPSAL